MKSVLVFTVILMASLSSFAAPKAEQVNQKALEILLANSGKLVVQGEGSGSLSALLSRELVSTASTHKKISNVCKFDTSDDIFKCTLFIGDKDDSGETESATDIHYFLEKDSSGLPSSNLFYMSVEASTAG